MLRNKKWLFGVSIIFLISCGGISKYEKEILDFRTLKNEQFKNPESSPLPKQQLANFKALSYFKVDKEYNFRAKFTGAALPQYVNLFPGENSKQIHQLRGTVSFEINHKKHSLKAYSSINQKQNKLFIPFRDLSNNFSSYGGGRYVEALLLNDTSCTLDFNFSYNPFCVYNEKYSCAIVPLDNFVQDSILAGEMYLKQGDNFH